MSSTPRIHVASDCSTSITQSEIVRASHTWTIQNFKHLIHHRVIESNAFSTRGVMWRMIVYPKWDDTPASGEREQKDPGASNNQQVRRRTGYMSLFLRHLNPKPGPSGVVVSFKLVNHKNDLHSYNRTCNNAWSFKKDKSRGYHRFRKSSVVADDRKGFLTSDGSIVIRIQIEFAALEFKMCLPEAPSLVKQDMSQLLKNGIHSDVDIKGSDYIRHAHKNILSIRSPVFRMMFEQKMKEQNENVVVIEDVDEEAMDAMLEHIYADVVPQASVAGRLLMLADRYQISGLLDVCQTVLAQSLSVDNAIEVAMIANLLSSPHTQSPRVQSSSRGSPGTGNSRTRTSNSSSSSSSVNVSGASSSSSQSPSPISLQDIVPAETNYVCNGPYRMLQKAVVKFIVTHLDEILCTREFSTLMEKCSSLATHILLVSRQTQQGSSHAGKKRKYPQMSL